MKTSTAAKRPAAQKQSTTTVRKAAASKRTSRSTSSKTENASRSHESRRGLMDRIQDMIGENEETIHLVLEIAAMTLERTEMSRKKKRISKAVLNLLSEILDTDYEDISHTTKAKA